MKRYDCNTGLKQYEIFLNDKLYLITSPKDLTDDELIAHLNAGAYISRHIRGEIMFRDSAKKGKYRIGEMIL